MDANSRQDILYDRFDTVIREVDTFIVKPVSAVDTRAVPQFAERGLGDDVGVERNIGPTSAVNEIVLVILDTVVEGDAMVSQGVAFQR